jgi:hypothetical protein
LRQHEDFVHSHDHVSAPGTVHPATVLEELSKMRFQSKEWSDAVIAVDVGDVTLVRCHVMVREYLLTFVSRHVDSPNNVNSGLRCA